MKVASEPEAIMKSRADRGVELTNSFGSINKCLNSSKTDSGEYCLSSLRKNWQISSCAWEREEMCAGSFNFSKLAQEGFLGRLTKFCSRLRTRGGLVVSCGRTLGDTIALSKTSTRLVSGMSRRRLVIETLSR